MRATQSTVWYKQFQPLGFLDLGQNLGKGEVESSILSCSTIFPHQNNGLVTVLIRRFSAARQNMARTDRDLAPLSVQNACSGSLEGFGMARETPTWVYVMTCGEYAKIGIATHVGMRLRGLQGQNPFKVEVYGDRLFESYSIARSIETELHAEFAEHRGYGEWFKVEPEAVMASLRQWGEYQREPDTTPRPQSYVPPKSAKRPPGITDGQWCLMQILDQIG